LLNIEFESRSPTLVRDIEDAPDKVPPQRLRGYLHLPENHADPVPAVVILEGLGGLIDSREFAYARELAAAGYAAFTVDSFGPRGAAPLSHPRRAIKVTEAMLLADAFAAKQCLAGHPAVDQSRIFVKGYSYGAMCAVLTAYEQIRRTFADTGAPFAGHIAYYGCSVPRLDDPTTTGAPVLIMLGEHDRNVWIERSRQIAEDLERGGSPVRHEVLAGAYHQWDGENIEPMFEKYSLWPCCMRLDRNNRAREERTGLPISGRISRLAAILLGTRLSGYYMQRDEAALTRSNALLYDFLARHGATRAAAMRAAE